MGYGTFVQTTPSFDRRLKPSCDSASIQRLASASHPALAREITSTLPGPKSRPLMPAMRCHVAPSRVVQIPLLGSAAVPSRPTTHSVPSTTVPVSTSMPRAGAGTVSHVVPIAGPDEPGGHVRIVVSEGALRPDGDEPPAYAPDAGHGGLGPDVACGPVQDGSRRRCGSGGRDGRRRCGRCRGRVRQPMSRGSGDDHRRNRHQDPAAEHGEPGECQSDEHKDGQREPEPVHGHARPGWRHRRCRREFHATSRTGSTSTGTRSAYLPRATVRRSSKRVESVMVEVRPEAFEEASES